MIHNIYIDEEGPQEHLDVARKKQNQKRNQPKQRFRLGDDLMLDYVMAAIDIPADKTSALEIDFLSLEKNYLSGERLKDELKGQRLLKKKNLENGLASLPKRETQYYLDLLKLFENYDVTTCIVTENKIANIVNGRLVNWIETVAQSENLSPQLLDYILVIIYY